MVGLFEGSNGENGEGEGCLDDFSDGSIVVGCAEGCMDGGRVGRNV